MFFGFTYRTFQKQKHTQKYYGCFMASPENCLNNVGMLKITLLQHMLSFLITNITCLDRLTETNTTAVNPTGIYSCISYLYTVERTLCADSSACSHTRQALRGKETYGVFCIHFSFKIASLLLSFPSMASWKDSNELETPCLLWHSMHAPTYPMVWHFCTNLISTSAKLSWLDCFCVLAAPAVCPALFYPKLLLVE